MGGRTNQRQSLSRLLCRSSLNPSNTLKAMYAKPIAASTRMIKVDNVPRTTGADKPTKHDEHGQQDAYVHSRSLTTSQGSNRFDGAQPQGSAAPAFRNDAREGIISS